MSQSLRPDEDLDELIAARVLGNLSADEERDLRARSSHDAKVSADRLERVAAAIQLAFEGPRHPPMPKALYDKILSSALPQVSASAAKVQSAKRDPDLAIQDYSLTRREVIAWTCMAASLLLAFGLMYYGPGRFAGSNISRRASLINDPSSIQVAWTAGKTPFDNPVQGDVVWSNTRQEGYMKFANMPVNNPSKEQYQLWIIDPDRDDEPIDGGVFDVTSTGEIIVPIRAKLKVLSPKAFAITIEKPGGVVVSTQEKLPLLAPVP